MPPFRKGGMSHSSIEIRIGILLISVKQFFCISVPWKNRKPVSTFDLTYILQQLSEFFN